MDNLDMSFAQDRPAPSPAPDPESDTTPLLETIREDELVAAKYEQMAAAKDRRRRAAYKKMYRKHLRAVDDHMEELERLVVAKRMYVDEEVRGFVLSLIKETMRFAVDVTAVVVTPADAVEQTRKAPGPVEAPAQPERVEHTYPPTSDIPVASRP